MTHLECGCKRERVVVQKVVVIVSHSELQFAYRSNLQRLEERMLKAQRHRVAQRVATGADRGEERGRGAVYEVAAGAQLIQVHAQRLCRRELHGSVPHVGTGI